MKPVIYKSKVGIGLLLYVAGATGTVLVLMIVNKIWVGAFFISLVMVFIADMYFRTQYQVNGNELAIRCGFRYFRIVDISTIQKVSETNDFINSPALSTDRLEIIYNQSERVLISPANKMGFITHLLQLNPAITIRLKEHRKQ
jgi:hypothetical protein